MWLFTKMFFKLYLYIGTTKVLDRIVPISSYPQDELVDYLDFFSEEGYEIVPTTLETYLDFKMYQEMGDVTKFKDLQTENIRC